MLNLSKYQLKQVANASGLDSETIKTLALVADSLDELTQLAIQESQELEPCDNWEGIEYADYRKMANPPAIQFKQVQTPNGIIFKPIGIIGRKVA